MTSFPQFPTSPINGDTIEGAGSNITYEWRADDSYPNGGYWKARVYYYDLQQLDGDYVNVIGDVMSDVGDPGYPPDHPYDPGVLEDGTTFPGTDESESPSVKIQFIGDQRLDVRPKLVNENDIVQQPVGPGDDLYGVTISGDAFFNYTVEVHSNTLVKNTQGRVTYSHQWQSIITDSVDQFAQHESGTVDTYLQATYPDENSAWVDITGETSDKLRCTLSTFGYDPMDSPYKLVFVRCIETVTDERGLTSPSFNSNILGPFTFKP